MRVYKEKSMFEQILDLQRDYEMQTRKKPDTIELNKLEYDKLRSQMVFDFPYPTVPFEKLNYLEGNVTVFGMIVKPTKD